MRAWDVTGARPSGDLVIENSYVVADQRARHRRRVALIETDGRFALGYPRRDGGEEIDARIRATAGRWPTCAMRSCSTTSRIDGKISGEFHLYGKYETPFGFGTLQIDEGVA